MIGNNQRIFTSMYINGNNNLVEDNDYTRTHLLGWDKSPNQLPCVFITQFAFDNTVNEHLFPPGTTVCNQVIDFPEVEGNIEHYVAEAGGDYVWDGQAFVEAETQGTGTHNKYEFQGCGSAGFDGLNGLVFEHETTEPLILVDGSEYYPAICDSKLSKNNEVSGFEGCDDNPNVHPYLEQMKGAIFERNRKRKESLKEKLGKDLPNFPQ
jgi:hypothetical protein